MLRSKAFVTKPKFKKMELTTDSSALEILEGIRLFFLILGFFFFIVLMVIVWIGKSSFSWPKTTGTILISEELQLLRNPRFFARILYQYSVRNITVKSRIIFIGHFLVSSSLDKCQEITARYPKEKDVTVHYHPGHPKLSVLEPGINKRLISYFITKLITIAICILLTTPSVLRFLLELT